MKRLRWLGAGLLALCMVLAGCSQDYSPGSSPNNSGWNNSGGGGGGHGGY
ncbi:hypothetical protein [Paludibacterium sp.]|nr:hypothetical protein [Paludibacterium sp.]MBV8646986.1 hypothetical protein [Paludibacterium sp.]